MSLVELIFNILFGIINFFLSIIPVIVLPDTFTDAVGVVSSSIATLSWLVPIKTALQIFVLWIPLWFVNIYFKGGDFAFRHLPIVKSNSIKSQ